MKCPAAALLVLVHAAGLCAQNVYFSPAGYQASEGNAGNTIPWWSGSATYQQVHDAFDLARVLPGGSGLLRGLAFRKDRGTGSPIAARSLEAQITLGITPVTAGAISTTFATNLGSAPVVVLPFTVVSLPALVNTAAPNPPGWTFSFLAPFLYLNPLGNLCWELRFKNASSMVDAMCDAFVGFAPPPWFAALLGPGCQATGRAGPATIGARSLDLATGVFVHRLDLARASAPAVLALGTALRPVSLPGLCAPLETLPLVSFAGTTNATGSWTASLVLGDLTHAPPTTVYAQFAFVDAGLPYGFGVSSCSPVMLQPSLASGVARAWASAVSSGQGNETATSGFVEHPRGLVTGFLQ